MLRELQQILDTVSGTVTETVRLFVLGIFAIVVVLSIAGWLTAPVIAEKAGEHAERISEKVIEAERQELRARALAAEGWGYSDPARDDADRFEDERRRADDYWGADTE